MDSSKKKKKKEFIRNNSKFRISLRVKFYCENFIWKISFRCLVSQASRRIGKSNTARQVVRAKYKSDPT